MLCPNCGMEVEEQEQTCLLCGYLFENPVVNTESEPILENNLETESNSSTTMTTHMSTSTPFKRRSKLPIVIGILAILVAVLLVLVVMLLLKQENTATNPAKTVSIATETTTLTEEAATTEENITEIDSLSMPILGEFLLDESADSTTYYIEWEAVEGADGYEINVDTIDSCGEGDNSLSVTTEPKFTTSSNYLVTVTIEVRAYCKTGQEKKYSNWSEAQTITLNEPSDEDTAYADVYRDVLNSYSREMTLAYDCYYLCDLNHDGIKELLYQFGTCEADCMIDVYTIENGSEKFAGSISGFSCWVVTDGVNYFTDMTHTGSQIISKIIFDGDSVTMETFAEYDCSTTDYHDFGEGVNCYNGTDYSGLA